MNRRSVILGGAAALALPFVRARAAGPNFTANPFSLGIASGCPTQEGCVLWTRLAPDPLNGGGLDQTPVEVGWEIAEDEAFTRIVQRGTAQAIADEAHSVHVELRGLQPHRWYWYRFAAGSAISPIGRTRTAAAAGMMPLRLALASCQQYEQGYFSAYRHMAREDLDLVVHVGDYIYELSWGRQQIRRHLTGIPTTLLEYRNRYALYKGEADLQAAHAAFPWLVTWDDHEVADDYTNDRSPFQADAESFKRLRAAAYRAFWEHMPLPMSAKPSGSDAIIYGGWRFGNLAEIIVLDDRQYRSRHACFEGKRGAGLTGDCAERLSPDRTMFGATQERWLDQRLAQRNGRWTVIAQQTLMAELDRGRDAPAYWMDGWGGYPAARQRLLDGIAGHRVENPLVLGGDVHSYWVTDLKRDARHSDSPTVASEIVGTSITSDGPNPQYLERLLAKNPHVKYARADKRGYTTVRLGEQKAEIVFRAIDNVVDANTGIADLARFTIENGRPGAWPS
ncbi:MAG: alkaline phosphatase [Alphaproteobacteria bacterium]|jgi:alkaline phosphatase D|nr:alkaline phosphatase [Alphaproteobacteria bacterium]